MSRSLHDECTFMETANTPERWRGEDALSECCHCSYDGAFDVGVKQGRPGNRQGVWVSGMQIFKIRKIFMLSIISHLKHTTQHGANVFVCTMLVGKRCILVHTDTCIDESSTDICTSIRAYLSLYT